MANRLWIPGIWLLGMAVGCTAESDNAIEPNPVGAGHGVVAVELLSPPKYVEGFDYGVRVELNGRKSAERLLAAFDGAGRRDDQGYMSGEVSTRFRVRAGEAVLASDLQIGAGPPPQRPDFAAPCRTEVTVGTDVEVRLVLSWTTGCLELRPRAATSTKPS